MKRALLLLGSLSLAAVGLTSAAEEVEVHIRVINGRSGRPIPDEQLNVYRSIGQRDSEIFPTDRNGGITLRVDRSASIGVGSNIYVTCHPYRPGDTSRFYSVEGILSEGFTDSNMCGKAKAYAVPGEFIFFERPRTIWEWMRL